MFLPFANSIVNLSSPSTFRLSRWSASVGVSSINLSESVTPEHATNLSCHVSVSLKGMNAEGTILVCQNFWEQVTSTLVHQRTRATSSRDYAQNSWLRRFWMVNEHAEPVSNSGFYWFVDSWLEQSSLCKGSDRWYSWTCTHQQFLLPGPHPLSKGQQSYWLSPHFSLSTL